MTEDLEKGYRFREPAPLTTEFMKEQRDFNKQIELSMKDMNNDVKNICKTIEFSNNQNAEEHKAMMSRLGRIEKFALGTLVIFALSALYFLFKNAGLPTP